VSSSSLPSPTPRLKLRLTPAGERAVRSGHPWIFAESIREQNRDGQSGELAVIYTRESNRYLGTGFYDANSPMRVRMLASTQQTTINTDWWQARLNTAVAARACSAALGGGLAIAA
jgi:23S rRNA (cytosine1962-C5)-methyltransferase